MMFRVMGYWTISTVTENCK
uniref:Uncharacterized protein n=1 Tax=Anguilla anguilla TaxID=7936 RepID=A0A0E9SXZ3_ANGAN